MYKPFPPNLSAKHLLRLLRHLTVFGPTLLRSPPVVVMLLLSLATLGLATLGFHGQIDRLSLCPISVDARVFISNTKTTVLVLQRQHQGPFVY